MSDENGKECTIRDLFTPTKKRFARLWQRLFVLANGIASAVDSWGSHDSLPVPVPWAEGQGGCGVESRQSSTFLRACNEVAAPAPPPPAASPLKAGWGIDLGCTLAAPGPSTFL